MAPKDLDRLIEKYLEGNCTAEEVEFINSLYAALGRNAERPADRASARKISSAGNRMLKNLQAHSGASVPDAFTRASWWRYTGIAASMLLILAAGFYFQRKQFSPTPDAQPSRSLPFASAENTSATKKRMILPDGSIVQMSPDSRIRFTNDIQTPVRELYLEGEAYFDVAHNNERPFYVYAGDVVTKVVGTSFIVRAIGADEKVTVSVKTGKVTVYTKHAMHKKTVLVPNQEAVYDQRTDVVATQPVPVSQLNEEKQHYTEMHFEETPVSEVLAALTRTYDIQILFEEDSLSGCVLTSSFYEEGLYDRIDVICTAIGATYKIVDARIVIESHGCNIKTK